MQNSSIPIKSWRFDLELIVYLSEKLEKEKFSFNLCKNVLKKTDKSLIMLFFY